MQGNKEKGKQKKRIDRVEEEEIGGQKEGNRMESVKEGSSSFSLVVYFVSTGNL